uniref:Lipocalin/cytosolic fatty-acid binding domain-containing protein n=2 Tax=Equus asinus TaxID=9793 RepID=A0A8C4M9T6_EQUAS|nr:female-specific lacrimal gland protein-like [Equus asinus]XP_044624132.1 female-specific lacrimal gland protein-like [Equus asinus]
MKILLLTLVLGVVCADQEPQSETDYSLTPGEWYTTSIASDDTEKIQENGPLRGYSRRIECISNCSTVAITFYQKINGECRKYIVVGTSTKDDIYKVDFLGENYFQFIFKSSDSLVIYGENVDDEGKVTLVTELLAKEHSVSEQDYQKFKELTEEKGIPAENIEDIINTDDCPN